MIQLVSKREGGLRQVLQRHALLSGLVAVYVATSFSLAQLHNVPAHAGEIGTAIVAFVLDVPMMIFFVLFWRMLILTYVQRDPNRFGTLKSEVVSFLSDRARMTGGGLAVVLMAATMIAFGQLKSLIPVLNPFSWDEFFMHTDRILHFGTHPYQIAHAILGWDYVITFLTGTYNFWLFMMYFALFGACFMRSESSTRMQFLVAFLLTWAVGGNFLATIFSSAGPTYFEKLGLGNTYAGLDSILRHHAALAPITVVELQDLLWDLHNRPKPLNAISAFPSMHVASSVLMAIFLSHLSRALGIIASLFALCIMIGSVLLGWHYAVDGYVGALIAVAFWYFAGWLVRLTERGQLNPLAKASASS